MLKHLLQKQVIKILKLLPPVLKQPRLKMWFQDTFHISLSPTIIYQMGKVGSATIYESLNKARLPNLNSIYHVHFLSHEGIEDAEKYFRSKNLPLPDHLQVSKMLRQHIDRAKGIKWRVITLVREPIGRDISDLFHNMRDYYPDLFESDGTMRTKDVINFLQTMFENYDEHTDYTCTWFDRELKRTFDIDVYGYPFDHEKGFTIIREKNLELLILRLEDLNTCFTPALAQFFSLTAPLQKVDTNIAVRKDYSVAYQNILKRLVIPKPVCVKIYSSKYAQHFYTQAMRETLIRKWSKNRQILDKGDLYDSSE